MNVESSGPSHAESDDNGAAGEGDGGVDETEAHGTSANEVFEIARSIRPYLADLVGPDAGEFDTQISELLNTSTPGSASALRALLASNETTADFMDEVLRDAHLRPPAVQRDEALRGSNYTPLPGPQAPVQAVKYVCRDQDYVWYQPGVGTPRPLCPTHLTTLVPA